MERVLVVRASRWSCALPVEEVEETMRELEILPRAGAPSWVRGVSVIRGTPTPVVDLASFLGGESSAERGRFVTMRCHGRPVALRVDRIVGVRTLSAASVETASPLLGVGGEQRTALLATLDDSLLAVLDVSRVLTDGDFDTLYVGIAP